MALPTGQQVLESIHHQPGPAERPNGKAGKDKSGLDHPIYYEAGRSGFWVMNSRGEYTRYSEDQLARVLRSRGFSRGIITDNSLNQVEAYLLELQMNHDCLLATQLGGYLPGLHQICGMPILITRGPKIPAPKRGAWDTLKKFLDELLGENRPWFDYWMKSARLALAAGPPWRPGQALALAGPANSGKNFLQSIITEILGGRSAKPYRYLIGETTFNGDFIGVEHLVIQDECPSTDIRSRRNFGANLKNIVANETQSLHMKGKDAVTVTPYWRVSISLNETPEDLLTLPPLEEGIIDKIILLQVKKATFPYDPENIYQRTAFRGKITTDIPGYLHYLKALKIPEDKVSRRFGVTDFQDSALVSGLRELAPEAKLWEMIQKSTIFALEIRTWRGSAQELETALRNSYKGGEVDRILHWSNACGVYLAKLSNLYPENVMRARGADKTSVWSITLPGYEAMMGPETNQ